MAERVQKVLAQRGIASRRRIEAWITAGRVSVNGRPAHLGQTVDPNRDRIAVDGRVIESRDRPPTIYRLVHKPLGVVSTCADPQGRRTILDILPPDLATAGLYPVGRLDINSTGALLVTNDGDLTYKLTHPRYHIPKTYRVTVAGQPQPKDLDQWRHGLVLDGHPTKPAIVEVIQATATETVLKVILTEGRNRQIRRIAELLGYPVKRLHRQAIGSIQLGNLPRGHSRPLHQKEVNTLESFCNENR